MSGFTPLVTFETEFDGDTITFKLRRLKQKHMLLLSPHLEKMSGDDVKISFTDAMEAEDVLSKIIPDCIDSMEGLKTADGAVLNVSDIVGELYFSRLIGKIMGKLYEISSPKGDEIKKSSAELEDTSEA